MSIKGKWFSHYVCFIFFGRNTRFYIVHAGFKVRAFKIIVVACIARRFGASLPPPFFHTIFGSRGSVAPARLPSPMSLYRSRLSVPCQLYSASFIRTMRPWPLLYPSLNRVPRLCVAIINDVLIIKCAQ